MAKYIDCQFVPVQKLTSKVELLSNAYPKQSIDNLLWSNNGYFPAVEFCMAYTDHSIFLNYFVKEKYAIATHTKVNDLVYKDSCVEFFVSFDDGLNYYNLEFNCIGTPYGAYGLDNANRIKLPDEIVELIKIHTQTKNIDSEGITEWEIALDIPFDVFIYDAITSLKEVSCRANFYKCGDETPEPHYLSWNNILINEPNFHVPEFFGTVNFV